jgi:hypothetical protein
MIAARARFQERPEKYFWFIVDFCPMGVFWLTNSVIHVMIGQVWLLGPAAYGKKHSTEEQPHL